jgi:hypothetical protein
VKILSLLLALARPLPIASTCPLSCALAICQTGARGSPSTTGDYGGRTAVARAAANNRDATPRTSRAGKAQKLLQLTL